MSTLSFQFLGFVLLVFTLSFLAKGTIRKFIFLLANIIFLLTFGKYIHIIWVSLAIIYSFIILKVGKNHKQLLLMGIVPLILSLGYFKYWGLWTNNNIIMPLGISFYTFKIISVLVDTYKGKIKGVDLLDYAIYVGFFPVISAGPINRYEGFVEGLNETKASYKFVKNGAVLCAFGLFQKLVFANFLGIVVSNAFAKDISGLTTLFAILAYSYYIYTDFDGYSNIAIGISQMLGFKLERNFKTPYLASSIMDFWDRWHISLSSWLKDYIYIPLGGNRKGFVRKCINILIVFFISGIWHGSTIVFIIWGLGHGLVNVVENIIKNQFKNVEFPTVIKYIGKVCGILINFVIVSLLWIFFRSSSLSEAFGTIESIFTGTLAHVDYKLIGLTLREYYYTLIIIAVVIITDIMRNKVDMIAWLSRRIFIIRWFVYIALVFLALIFGVYGPGYNAQDFIYAIF